MNTNFHSTISMYESKKGKTMNYLNNLYKGIIKGHKNNCEGAIDYLKTNGKFIQNNSGALSYVPNNLHNKEFLDQLNFLKECRVEIYLDEFQVRNEQLNLGRKNSSLENEFLLCLDKVRNEPNMTFNEVQVEQKKCLNDSLALKLDYLEKLNQQ